MSNVRDTLQSLLDEGGISYRQNSKSFILECPRCQKRDKLYIRKSDGRFVCWKCSESEGFHGAAEWALAELLSRPAAEIRKQLQGTTWGSSCYLDIRLNDFFGALDEIPYWAPEDLVEVEPDPGFRDLDHPASQDGVAYLEGRGVSKALALEYGIKYHPATRRVIFPVISHGKLLGWQGRYAGQEEYFDPETGEVFKTPKTLTSLGLKKERTFMFGDRLTVGGDAILCEGPFDAVKAHLCGGNVAALGKGVSDYQLEILKHSGIKRLYLALDPDAFAESKRVLEKTVDDLEVYDMRPPPDRDLGAMSLEAVLDLKQKAPRIYRNYLFLYLKNPYE